MDNPSSLIPNSWTPIAKRPRGVEGRQQLLWEELPMRILGLAEAHALAAKGIILMANRHLPDRVELVVRPAALG